jgi:hypothetical protein
MPESFKKERHEPTVHFGLFDLPIDKRVRPRRIRSDDLIVCVKPTGTTADQCSLGCLLVIGQTIFISKLSMLPALPQPINNPIPLFVICFPGRLVSSRSSRTPEAAAYSLSNVQHKISQSRVSIWALAWEKTAWHTALNQ